jgi:hypothetical protein
MVAIFIIFHDFYIINLESVYFEKL